MENINIEETLFEKLDSTDVESLNVEEAEKFCELIEVESKAVINQFTYIVSNTQNGNLARALVKYVNSDNIFIRNLSGEILVNMGNVAVDPLIRALDGGDKHKKKFIIDVLGLIGNPAASDKIMQIMKSDEDENVVLACIEALGNIRDERAVAHLIKLYSVNELYIPSIIEALGKIGSDSAVDFIISKYDTEDELIKYSIVESLGNIGNAQSFYFLLGELKNLEGPICWAAIESVYKLSQKFNLEIPFDESFKNKVLKTLYDADVNYKEAALNLILSYDDDDIYDAYLAVLGSNYEIDALVKEKLLGNIKASIQGIHKRLEDKSDNIPALLNLLEEMYDASGIDLKDYMPELEVQAFIDALAGALELPQEEARKSAMSLLFKIDPGSAFLFLDKMLSDDNLWNRLFVLDLLENFSLNEEALQMLEQIGENADEMVKERITELVEYNRNQLQEN